LVGGRNAVDIGLGVFGGLEGLFKILDAKHVVIYSAAFLLYDLSEGFVAVAVLVFEVFLSEAQVLVVLLFYLRKSHPLAVLGDQGMRAASR